MMLEKKRAKALDALFTENINPIMMQVNNTQNCRFGGNWAGVKAHIQQLRVYLDNLEAIADEQLSG